MSNKSAEGPNAQWFADPVRGWIRVESPPQPKKKTPPPAQPATIRAAAVANVMVLMNFVFIFLSSFVRKITVLSLPSPNSRIGLVEKIIQYTDHQHRGLGLVLRKKERLFRQDRDQLAKSGVDNRFFWPVFHSQ